MCSYFPPLGDFYIYARRITDWFCYNLIVALLVQGFLCTTQQLSQSSIQLTNQPVFYIGTDCESNFLCQIKQRVIRANSSVFTVLIKRYLRTLCHTLLFLHWSEVSVNDITIRYLLPFRHEQVLLAEASAIIFMDTIGKLNYYLQGLGLMIALTTTMSKFASTSLNRCDFAG